MPTRHLALLRERPFRTLLLAQAGAAFNDNLLRGALLVLIGFRLGFEPASIALYANLLAALFVLPFVLAPLAARRARTRGDPAAAFARARLLELPAALIGAWALVTQRPVIALIALLALGLRAALAGPLRPAVLARLLPKAMQPPASGLIESASALGILLGLAAGTALMLAPRGAVIVAALLIAGALFGTLCARAVARGPRAAAPVALQDLHPDEPGSVRRAQRGLAAFWFVGAALTAQLPLYAQALSTTPETTYAAMLALLAAGFALGWALRARVSGRTVELGLVLPGAIGMALGLIWLAIAADTRVAGAWPTTGVALALLAIGVTASWYALPLFAFQQTRAPAPRLVQAAARGDAWSALAVIAASALAILALVALDLPLRTLFAALAAFTALIALYLLLRVPEFPMRLFSGLMVGTLYRLRVHGLRHVPDEGAALVVCNHVSYMDALIVMGAVRRPVRFVMYHRIFGIPVLSWLFRAARCIPIAPAKEDAALMARAFAQIDAALAEGELIGIFPEGALTKDGAIAPFKSGVERILAARPVPVVPMALRGMWTSMWSRRDSTLRRARLPRRVRARVELVMDAPIAPQDATAAALEAKVRALRGDAA